MKRQRDEFRYSRTEFISQFIDFMGSEQGQQIIQEYGQDLYGEGIYNDAAYAKKFE